MAVAEVNGMNPAKRKIKTEEKPPSKMTKNAKSQSRKKDSDGKVKVEVAVKEEDKNVRHHHLANVLNSALMEMFITLLLRKTQEYMHFCYNSTVLNWKMKS